MIVLIAIIAACLLFSNFISYRLLKYRIVNSRDWDLNICCGKTDVGKVNADIIRHGDISNFVLIDSIYQLPFKDGEFNSVLCSHTMEHVDDPERFFNELTRVGKEVVLVTPPLYDLPALLNVFEHKWIFLSFRKKHTSLPPRVRVPFSDFVQKRWGQVKKA